MGSTEKSDAGMDSLPFVIWNSSRNIFDRCILVMPATTSWCAARRLQIFGYSGPITDVGRWYRVFGENAEQITEASASSNFVRMQPCNLISSNAAMIFFMLANCIVAGKTR